jgi:hypothetical protein
MEGIFGLMAIFFSLVLAVFVGIGTAIVSYKLARVNLKKIISILISILSSIIITITCFLLGSWLLVGHVLSGPAEPFWKPSEKHVIGIWELRDFSKENLKERGYDLSTNVLEFREDGTYLITNCPIWNGEFYSDSGTWKIEKGRQDNWGIKTYSAQRENDFFWFIGNRPPYTISASEPWEMWGPVIVFERKEK